MSIYASFFRVFFLSCFCIVQLWQFTFARLCLHVCDESRLSLCVNIPVLIGVVFVIFYIFFIYVCVILFSFFLSFFFSLSVLLNLIFVRHLPRCNPFYVGFSFLLLVFSFLSPSSSWNFSSKMEVFVTVTLLPCT